VGWLIFFSFLASNRQTDSLLREGGAAGAAAASQRENVLRGAVSRRAADGVFGLGLVRLSGAFRSGCNRPHRAGFRARTAGKPGECVNRSDCRKVNRAGSHARIAGKLALHAPRREPFPRLMALPRRSWDTR